MYARLLAASLALATTALADSPDSAVRVGELQQAIWSACADVMPAGVTPSAAQVAACDARRRTTINALQRIGAGPNTGAAIRALGLVIAWATPAAAQAALARLARDHRDDDRTATALEVAYGDSRAPDKRAEVTSLISATRSRAVAGTGSYLVADQTLANRASDAAARAQAIARLRRVVARYGDVPTQLLGAGDPPRLGRVAAALLFRTERLRPGAPLPLMQAQDLDGDPVSSATFRGKVTLIDFWATWCPPCVAAMPTLRHTQAAYAARGLQIVSVSADTAAAAVKAFVAREGNTWPQWRIGPSGVVSPEWSNNSYPFYILVDRQGRIVVADQQLPSVLRSLAVMRL